MDTEKPEMMNGRLLTRTQRLARLLLSEANPSVYPPAGPDDVQWELVAAEDQHRYLQRAERIAEQLPEGDYEIVRDVIAERLNPPDDDAAETHICTQAIEAAADFIAAYPCSCSGNPEDGAYDACERCKVLGRLNDEPVAR